MVNTLENVLELIDNHVSEYVERNKNLLPLQVQINPDNLEHVKQIAASIMRTKWNVGYPGGSFVQAVVDNNLSESFGRADIVNRDSLFFYCVMIKNLDMPMDVYRYKTSIEVE